MKKIEVFTDGACFGNPGPGGWAAILRYKNTEKEIFGYEEDTTNNRMELSAVINALETIKEPCSIEIFTDSQYVKNGMEKWIHNWKKKNYKTKSGEERKNADLWRKLDNISSKHNLHWHWVRGHSGHSENERVDFLAKKAIRERGGGERWSNFVESSRN